MPLYSSLWQQNRMQSRLFVRPVRLWFICSKCRAAASWKTWKCWGFSAVGELLGDFCQRKTLYCSIVQFVFGAALRGQDDEAVSTFFCHEPH